MNKIYEKSVASGAKLEKLFSLGEIYVSDFLTKDEKPKYPPCKLEFGFDPVSKLAQLTEQPPNEAMFGSFYWYLSNTNPQMRESLKDLALKTIESIPFKEESVYLDIASNDGTLLSYVPWNFIRIGIDPSKYTPVPDCGMLIREYFSSKVFYSVSVKKARYVTCAAMFYDLSNPEEFISDVYNILEEDGIFVLQLSYTPLMIQQIEIGNICHEHLCYYNLTSLKYLFDKVGFIIKDVELNNVNGGSIRVFLQKENASNFKSAADNDISSIRINSLLEWEENNGYNSPEIYLDFFNKILKLKEQTINFIKEETVKGKIIYGYGASTKAATLYQFFGLTTSLVPKIAEKQDRKVGLRTVGTDIEIISDEQMRKENPDYLLIGPWFFVENFKKREQDYLKGGGKFILPAPKFSIYG